MATSRQRATPAQRARLAAIVSARHAPCGICGDPIDYDLHYPNPLSFSVDHLVPFSARPDLELDPGNCQAAHLVCNQSRGKGLLVTERVTSRKW